MKYFYFLILLYLYAPVCTLGNETQEAAALLEKGDVAFQKGDYAGAQMSYEKSFGLYQDQFGPRDTALLDVVKALGMTAGKMYQSAAALEKFELGLEILKQTDRSDTEQSGDFHRLAGNVYKNLSQPQKSFDSYQRCLEIYLEQLPSNHQKIGGLYMNLGLLQYQQGRYLDAEQDYIKALGIFNAIDSLPSRFFEMTYANMGLLYYVKGDHERSIEYNSKALRLASKRLPPNHPYFALVYKNLGRAYQGRGELSTSIANYQKALDIYQGAFGKNHIKTTELMAHVSNCYLELNQHNKALSLANEVLEIREQSDAPYRFRVLSVHYLIANILKEQGKQEEAENAYQYILDNIDNCRSCPAYFINGLYKKMTEHQIELGNIDDAIHLSRESIQAFVPEFEFEKNDYYSNPEMDLMQAPEMILESFQLKSYVLQEKYKKEDHLNDLKAALETSDFAIRYMERVRRGFQSDAAKQQLAANLPDLYKQAVDQAYLLYEVTSDQAYLNRAFQYSEKSKANTLRRSLAENLALSSSGIPQEQLDSVAVTKTRISELIEQLEGNEITQAKKTSIRSDIFDLKNKLEDRISAFEQYNPQYYQAKYASDEVDAGYLINTVIDASTTLVEYFYTDDHLFVFLLSKEGIKGTKISLGLDLGRTISVLTRHDVDSLSFDQKSNGTYASSLHDLYDLLIAPIQADLSDVEDLIIVPHGVLGFLSFEMLAPVSDEADFRKLDYLIRRHYIHYAWSAALIERQDAPPRSAEIPFAGFAPDFSKSVDLSGELPKVAAFRSSMGILHHAIPEIEAANKYFPGTLYVNEDAIESTFLKAAPKSRIIHLATHALVDDEFPVQSGLLFTKEKDNVEDGFLNTLEIYNLKLSAELAVMSACNTGYGKLAEGEGVISLGRAFLYAGCKSIMTSLWLANDASTSSIMQSFYKYSAQGLHKHKALRKAKLDYLESTKDPLTAHPYFWANMVLVGDMGPLKERSNGKWWFIGMVLLGGLAFVAFKRG